LSPHRKLKVEGAGINSSSVRMMRIVARLIGAEHDRDRRTRIGLSFPFYYRDCWLAFAKARSQSQFHSAIKVAQRLQQFFILPMREATKAVSVLKTD